MIGRVMNLMLESEHHSKYSLGTFARCISPPLNIGQHYGLHQYGHLVAWCSWALVSNEVLDKFKRGIDLTPDEWRSGDNILFMDWIAPFGHTREMFYAIKGRFRGMRIHWVRWAKCGRVVNVMNKV